MYTNGYYYLFPPKKTNGYPGELEVWDDIYSGTIVADLAIYGSSRAWVHFNSSILETELNKHVYNFGIDGHNFKLQYARHLEYLKNNQEPKTIIISVDITTLEPDNELYQIEQFLPYLLWNSNLIKYTSSLDGFKTVDYYIPLIRYAGKYEALKIFFNYLTHPQAQERYRYHGYRGLNRQWGPSQYGIPIAPRTPILDNDLRPLMENFIIDAQIRGIEIILVYAPEYISFQTAVINRDEFVNYYKFLAKKYSLKFLDYSNDPISSNPNLFYNHLHLNQNGADIFTGKLAKDLKNQIN